MSSALPALRAYGLMPATGNRGKLAELSRLLQPLGVRIVAPADRGIVLSPDETGVTFRDNAELKARAFFNVARMPVLADDSGLCVDALGGEPGVLSARFGGPGLDDAARCRHLLGRLAHEPEPWPAHFTCVLALVLGEDDIRFAEGSAHGQILREPRGASGFGYDPIFLDLESGLSYAELSAQDKDRRSHRGHALQQLLDSLTVEDQGVPRPGSANP